MQSLREWVKAMSIVEEEIENHTKEAVRVVKRVIAGKGKITANFYFTSDNGGEFAGMILTLIMRDRKGQQVYNRGRNLRRLMKTTKFAHGTLTFLDGKLDFELVAGNASPMLLSRSFKKHLSHKKGLIKLRTARIHRPQEEAVEDVEEVLTTAEREQIEREEQEFIQEVKRESQSASFALEVSKLQLQEKMLGSRIKKQRTAYLNTIKVGTEIREIVDEQIAEIALLKTSNDPQALEKIAQARRRLAEATSVSSDPYAEDPESLPSEVMETLEAAYSLSGAHIQQDLMRNVKKLKELYQQVNAEKGNLEWINTNKQSYQAQINICMRAIRQYRFQLQEYLKMG